MKQKIGFIGLGLIGGSIAKTIKKKYPDTTLIATARHADTIQEAHDFGTIENDTLLPLSDFADCDYIFLCTPVQQNLIYLKKLKSVIKPSCIITDVGSVKSDIHKAVTALGMEANFIGGHPMCGSEKTGFFNATEYLLENAYYIITPTAKTTPAQLEEFHASLYSVDTRLEWMYEKAKEDHTFRTDIPKEEFFRVTVHTMMTACTYCASGFIWGSEDNKDYTPELRRIKEMILNYAKISE